MADIASSVPSHKSLEMTNPTTSLHDLNSLLVKSGDNALVAVTRTEAEAEVGASSGQGGEGMSSSIHQLVTEGIENQSGVMYMQRRMGRARCYRQAARMDQRNKTGEQRGKRKELSYQMVRWLVGESGSGIEMLGGVKRKERNVRRKRRLRGLRWKVREIEGKILWERGIEEMRLIGN